jgi:hypothetical protein
VVIFSQWEANFNKHHLRPMIQIQIFIKRAKVLSEVPFLPPISNKVVNCNSELLGREVLSPLLIGLVINCRPVCRRLSRVRTRKVIV